MTTAQRTQGNSSAATERFLRVAQQVGCPADQVRNFLRAGVVMQPRQLEASAKARLCDQPNGPTEVAMGGARGGGKSYWMLGQMGADDCQRYAGLKCLLLRRVGKAVKEGFQDLLPKVFKTLEYRYVPSQMLLEFPQNGSRIVLGHFHNENDIDAYLGLEYDVIGVEEETTLTASKSRAIGTCLRTSKLGWRPRRYSTTNPGGIGHKGYKRRFIVPWRQGKETNTRFIPSTVDDNRMVNVEYRSTLDALSGWQYRAWRHGDWDIDAGAFFSNWLETVHVREVALPSHWRVWCAMDYGFQHYTVVYLIAEDDDGNVYVIDEHAWRKWLVPQHAEAIKAMLGRHGVGLEELECFVAGADVFAKRDGEPSVGDKYAALGIKLTTADMDRVSGAAEILGRLGNPFNDEAGVGMRGLAVPPRFFVSPRCHKLIECLPAMLHDPNRPEDVLKMNVDDEDEDSIGDDPYDAVRYGVMVAARRGKQSVRSSSPVTGYRG